MTPEQSQALDAEIWKPVLGFEGLYEVSNLGRVRAMFSTCNLRFKPGRLVKPVARKNGYSYVGLYLPKLRGDARERGCCKHRGIHVMILESFSGPRPNGEEPRHLDGNRGNNVLSNLKWGTRKENMADAIRHGTFVCGENSNLAKLSEVNVSKIRALFDVGVSGVELASYFSISRAQVSRIGRRKSWSHLG